MGSFRGVGSVGRGARVGLWAAIAVLFVGGGVGAATVEPGYGDPATPADLERLKAAGAAVAAEQQITIVQKGTGSGATSLVTCVTIRPATRCDQSEPIGRAHVYVTAADGFYLAVPEARRSASEGKAWVRVAETSPAPTADSSALFLGSATEATVRPGQSVGGADATYFRFSMPKRQIAPPPNAPAGSGSMEMTIVVEAWLDESNRPLRTVQRMTMTMGQRTVKTTLERTHSYGAAEPFAVPGQADALTVATMDDANRIAMGR